MSKEKINAMDSGNESDHDPISTEMFEKMVTEVSLIQTIIEEKHVIKYVIALGKYNWNKKER